MSSLILSGGDQGGNVCSVSMVKIFVVFDKISGDVTALTSLGVILRNLDGVGASMDLIDGNDSGVGAFLAEKM